MDGAWYTITTRETSSGEPIHKATSYVGQRMAAEGLDVEYHVWNNTTNPNVIGQITGLYTPDDIFIIGGHLDDVSGTPGADDNAILSLLQRSLREKSQHTKLNAAAGDFLMQQIGG